VQEKAKQAQRQRQEEEEEEEALFVDEDLSGEGSSSHEPPRPPRRRVAVLRGGASTLAWAIRSTRSATRSVIEVQPGSSGGCESGSCKKDY
jgi:hypothetical protein